MSTILLLSLLLVPPGCHWGGHGATSPPQGREELAVDDVAPVVMPEWLPPAVAAEDASRFSGPSADGHGRPSAEAGREATRRIDDGQGRPSVGAGRDAPGFEAPTGHGWPGAEEGRDASRRIDDGQGRPSVGAGRDAPGFEAPTGHGGPGAEEGMDASRGSEPSAHRQKPAAALHPVPAAPPKETRTVSVPGWAKSSEELVYRVDFVGITMGYARFRYEGKVLIAGKSAYHLNVRAWTSGVLSYIYPINDTIDYYLDAETLAPIRQEFTQRAKKKDDVALFNQETGRITYRYRQSGAIRKQVDTLPSIYDPVSVAYYFRWRDLGVVNRPRNVYGGRKIYQISTRVVGHERIRTDHGEMDTIAVVPVIRRDGKPDNKGDLKIWFSGDERRVPVRLYAKFRKIKEWTLVGELMPPATAMAGR